MSDVTIEAPQAGAGAEGGPTAVVIDADRSDDALIVQRVGDTVQTFRGGELIDGRVVGGDLEFLLDGATARAFGLLQIAAADQIIAQPTQVPATPRKRKPAAKKPAPRKRKPAARR